jgi:hypothetical protein
MARRTHDPVAARLVSPQLTGSLGRYLRSRGIPAGEVDEILGVARKTSMTGLAAGTTYSFRYRAVTKAGAADWSLAASAQQRQLARASPWARGHVLVDSMASPPRHDQTSSTP